MITADSSVWIGYLNGHESPQTRALDAVLDDSATEIVLLDLVLLEVFRGLRNQRESRLTRAAFQPLPIFTAGGESVALAAASMYRDLRGQGITVRSPIDLLIGSWCIQNDCMLLHDDRDFDGMERKHGLQSLLERG